MQGEKKESTYLMPGMKIEGQGLFLEKEKTLLIADLHLGIEEMHNSQGLFIPRINFQEIQKKIEKIIQKTQPKQVVINGDLKHEFGYISKQEWKEVIEMLEFLSDNSKEVTLLKGNHDNILGPIARKKGIQTMEELYIKKLNALILHGHRISKSEEFKKAKTLITAHEHPAIALREENRAENYKCFLKGKFEEKNLIVMPSMNAVSAGSNVLREKQLSPFLQKNILDFECWALEDKPYYFGKLKNI